MNLLLSQKSITIVAVSLAVIAAAVAAIVVSANRADEARAYARAKETDLDFAAETNKTAQAEAKKAENTRVTAETNAQAESNKLVAAKLDYETAKIEEKIAADNKAAAEADARAEEIRAEAARAIRDAAKLTNETARAELQKAKELAATELAKADAAAAKLAAEKLEADRAKDEDERIELRKIDFETIRQRLLEWEADLEERERALKPEKTVADLEWAGGMEDTVIDDKGNLTKQVKKVYDPEKDMKIPEQSRRLARTERKLREAQDAKLADTRNAVLKTMEKLYDSALNEGRVIDAEFYKKNILIMYPGWKSKGEKADNK